jgi:hypothetical protein
MALTADLWHVEVAGSGAVNLEQTGRWQMGGGVGPTEGPHPAHLSGEARAGICVSTVSIVGGGAISGHSTHPPPLAPGVC